MKTFSDAMMETIAETYDGRRMRIVGISGLAGSGKTTVARYLIAQHNYVRIRFADPLKQMMRVAGLSEDDVDGPSKEIPNDILCGRTPRYAMQKLGTEFGRELIGENFWANAWSHRVDSCLAASSIGIVADDVRFHNEAGAIYKYGGIVVKITRPDLELKADVAAHESERYANELPYDVHLINDGDIQSLLRKVDFRVARYWSEEKVA